MGVALGVRLTFVFWADLALGGVFSGVGFAALGFSWVFLIFVGLV